MNWRINLIMIVVLSLIYREGKAQLAAPKSDSLAAFQPPDIYRLDSSYLKEYPLVNFDLNYFQFYTESSPNWELLFDKMEKMCDRTQGKLNFYHIGGSHLQADIYTHDVRVKLQTQQNLLTGERGWVFPFDLAGTNNPWNFEFKSPNNWEKFRCVVPEQADESCGLMGIKVVGHDSISSLKFRYDKTKTKSEIQRIRVYHNKGTFPFTMDWGDKDAQLKSFHIDTIIGYTEVGFAYPFLDFELTFTRDIAGDFPLELYGFELLNDYPGISYSNVGINGASLHSFMACRRFEEQLKVTPPDFFAFSLGTNDGNVLPENFDPQVYKANLEYMMKTVLRTNPDCAILLTVPNDSYFHKTHLNPNIAREREVIRELAVKYKCPVWDLYGIMGGLGSSKKWMNHRLMRSDLVHFTAAGYHLKGDLYFDSFEKARAQFQQRDNKTVKLK